MKLLWSEKNNTSFEKKSSNYWLRNVVRLFSSWKIVVILVQSGLRLYDLIIVAAGVEMNKRVICSHFRAIMCLFDRTEDRI